MLAVKASNRRELVEDAAPLILSAASTPAIAATSSSRATMLIRLILDPADEHRSGANQMRQWFSFGEHFSEAMRGPTSSRTLSSARSPNSIAGNAGLTFAPGCLPLCITRMSMLSEPACAKASP